MDSMTGLRSLRTFSNWKRVRGACITVFLTHILLLFALYIMYKRLSWLMREHHRTYAIQASVETVWQQQELLLHIEALELIPDNLRVLSQHLMQLESQVVHLQEAFQGIEALERVPDGLGVLSQHLEKLESQVTHLQEAFQAYSLQTPVPAPSEERDRTIITAQYFAAQHGIDWKQMQAWINIQAFATALSVDSPPEHLLTPGQQSMVISYWKSQKVQYSPCDRCPHYLQVVDTTISL